MKWTVAASPWKGWSREGYFSRREIRAFRVDGMLRTGQDYLAALRDGSRVYIGNELSRDVTVHPAFRYTARSFAYERFYAGPQFVHALYNFSNCPWAEHKQQIDDLSAHMEVPAAGATLRAAE
jgi:hypothetical protein